MLKVKGHKVGILHIVAAYRGEPYWEAHCSCGWVLKATSRAQARQDGHDHKMDAYIKGYVYA